MKCKFCNSDDHDDQQHERYAYDHEVVLEYVARLLHLIANHKVMLESHAISDKLIELRFLCKNGPPIPHQEWSDGKLTNRYVETQDQQKKVGYTVNWIRQTEELLAPSVWRQPGPGLAWVDAACDSLRDGKISHVVDMIKEFAPGEMWPGAEKPFSEDDFEVSVWPGDKVGGQHVGRNTGGIMVRHKPTGISMHSGGERSQIKNREKATSRLRQLLNQLFAGKGDGVPDAEQCRQQAPNAQTYCRLKHGHPGPHSSQDPENNVTWGNHDANCVLSPGHGGLCRGFRIGDRVVVTANPVKRDYTAEGFEARALWGGSSGTIIEEHNSHGLCFTVEFHSSGLRLSAGRATYDPDEMQLEAT